jgi:hypothetical protein
LAQNRKLQDLLDANNVSGSIEESNQASLPIVYRYSLEGAATASVDITLPYQIMVIGVDVVVGGVGTTSDTVAILNGGVSITGNLSIASSSLGDVVSASSLSPTKTVAKGGTLRCTQTDGGGGDAPPVEVLVTAIRL